MNMYYQTMPPHDGRQPLTAAALSIIPGLGQFYVGDKRKGILFLDAAIINYIVLSIIIFSHAIAGALRGFASTYKFTLNTDLVSLINNAHFGSPASMLFIGAMLLFIWYAACDAYDKAFGIKRKKIYGDSIIDLSEATSGSYVGHIALMLSCLLLAILFVKAPDRPHQITEISFEMDQKAPPIKKPPVTNIIAKHNVADVSKHRIQEPPRVAQERTSESRKTTAAESAPPSPVKQDAPKAVPPAPSHPVPAPPTPSHAVAPMPTPLSMMPTAAVQPPRAELKPLAASSASHSTPMPIPVPFHGSPPKPQALAMAPSAFQAVKLEPGPVPSELVATPVGISVGPTGYVRVPGTAPALPAFLGGPSGTSGAAGPHPIAIASIAGTSAGAPSSLATAKLPTSGSSGGGCAGCGGTSGSGPAPIRASSGTKGVGSNPFAVTPTFHIGGAPGKSGNSDTSTPANPTKDGRDGAPSTATKENTSDVDFSLYMANLQRLIKKHWFPPKDSASRTLRVTFKISREGRMSNLQLSRGTGIGIADTAGLDAVEAAAPFFKPLPAGAPEAVDIEFTFDYNVFTGH
jgi:TonB family protein